MRAMLMAMNCYGYLEYKIDHGKLQVVQVDLKVDYIVIDPNFLFHIDVGIDRAKGWNVASAWTTPNLPCFIHSIILI